MKYKIKGINVIVARDYEEMSKAAANIVLSQVILQPNSILGLATGGTPVGMYKEIVKRFNIDSVDFSEIKSFNLDEYYPILKSNPQSYYAYMQEHLFNHINIPATHIHIPSGETQDAAVECLNYDKKIAEEGGIDLQILGIGNNGHIGFNEPNIHFESETHVVELDEDTIRANARFFEDAHSVPKQAISMGIKTIMHSKKILLLASGEAKAEIIEKMLLRDITPNIPASILQLHNDITVIIDESAAKCILPKLEEN